MKAPKALLDRLEKIENELPSIGASKLKLVVLLSQLGDFDSIEYAQALVVEMPKLQKSNIELIAIGIGSKDSADRFCSYTGFPKQCLFADSEPIIHQELGLYPGLKIAGGPWLGLLLMCAGIGSPGTLKEVLRGYSGDRSAPQRLDSKMFELAGGKGFQRPFELATVRLRNMVEVLGAWSTYVKTDKFLTQRGGTYLLNQNNELIYEFKDKGILGFSETMANPLKFLENYLVN